MKGKNTTPLLEGASQYPQACVRIEYKRQHMGERLFPSNGFGIAAFKGHRLKFKHSSWYMTFT